MPTEKADLFQVEGEHTGLLVAAWLEPELANRLAIPGGEPPDQLHITLCYCGDANEISDVAIARAIDRVSWAAESTGPLAGQIAGIGSFNASESSDNKDVLYANVDVPGLERLRYLVADMLESAGCAPLMNHGYTPHITLAYLEPGMSWPIQRIETTPIVIRSIWLSIGDRRMEVPLTNGEPIKMIPERHAIKSLGGGRIGGYMALWGDENNRDLDGEFFAPDTEEMTTIFKAMGALPWLYDHATDKTVKSTVVGKIDVLEPDDQGLWYEAQLDKSNQYFDAIQKLIAQRRLGTSSGTLPGARKVAKNGKILRWATVEGSGTTMPADPRQVAERPIAEIKSAFSQIGISFEPESKSGDDGKGDEESRLEIAAKLKLLDLLSFESEFLGV
jgi:2'-5' RNA ligase